jgi:hypothetical protein
MERDVVFLPKFPQANEDIAFWVAEQIWPGQGRRWYGWFGSLAIFLNDELAGAFVLHDWEHAWGRVEISGACVHPRAWSKAVFRELHRIVFDELGLETAFMRTSENDKLTRVLKAQGFRQTLTPHMRGDQGEITHVMKKEWFNG